MIVKVDLFFIEFFVVCASFFSYFCIFSTTSLLNFLKKNSNCNPETHSSSLKAGKIVTCIFLLCLLLLDSLSNFEYFNFFNYLYLFICTNAAAKINWNLFAATDTSMHVKILTTIYTHNPITQNELLKTYNRNIIFNARIPRLLALKQIQIVDGKYLITGNFVLMAAKILAFFRFLLGIPIRPDLNN